MWFVRKRKSNFERTSDFYKSLLSIEIESKKEMTSDSNIERNNGELTQRDSKYSELLSKFVEVYSKNQDDKFKKKKTFCVIVTIACILLVVILMVEAGLCVYFFRDNVASFLVAFATVFSAVLSAILVIPRIITTYLFNPKEDELIVNLVIEMQKQDVSNRRLNNRIIDMLEKDEK